MKNNFIVIALSGGIDSSISAWILKKLNYKITGVFMINWIESNNCYKNDLKIAILVSNILNIKLKIVNFSKIYKKKIFLNFLKIINKGETPNPDINCNKNIKFKLLLNYAISLGAKKLATGHYAKIKKNNNIYKILNSKDCNKDQTYFLYKLNQKQLSKIIFPIGGINKKDIRLIAKKINFPNWNKKDSYGICFINNKIINFLNKYISNKIGYIINQKNNILGLHIGFQFYTIGQKKNLKIKNNKLNYIFKKNLKKNILYITNKYSFLLFSIGIIINNISWVYRKPKNNKFFNIKVKHSKYYLVSLIRYINKKNLLIIFNKPQWGITLGQSVVLYQKNSCLGGGVIQNNITLFKNY